MPQSTSSLLDSNLCVLGTHAGVTGHRAAGRWDQRREWPLCLAEAAVLYGVWGVGPLEGSRVNDLPHATMWMNLTNTILSKEYMPYFQNLLVQNLPEPISGANSQDSSPPLEGQ